MGRSGDSGWATKRSPFGAAGQAALRQGRVYVQVNSQKAPEGNLWGWLLPEHPFPGADVPEKGQGFLPQLDAPGNWVEK